MLLLIDQQGGDVRLRMAGGDACDTSRKYRHPHVVAAYWAGTGLGAYTAEGRI